MLDRTRVLVLVRFGRPSAHAEIIRARCASACAVVGRRAQRSNVSRSSVVNIKSGIGWPRSMRVPVVREERTAMMNCSVISNSGH